MADQRDGGIAWSDETWNPVRGCSRVSEGCRSCYAEAVAARFSGPGMPYEGLARRSPSGDARWTGEVRMVPEHLGDPLRWKRPRRIFVNSMSDLFHEKLADEDIAAVFGVMAAAPTHTFQILTKRAERMRDWFTFDWSKRFLGLADIAGFASERLGKVVPYGTTWPLPNAWIGVSIENQATADERVPLLVQTPATVRFVSAEPLLGTVDFSRWLDAGQLHQIIIGGESGRDPRPFQVGWARSIVGQCRRAGCSAFVKQLGANVRDVNDGRFAMNAEDDDVEGAWPDAVTADDRVEFEPDGVQGRYQGEPVRVHLLDRTHGGDMGEWPRDIRVREFPR